MGDVTGFEEPGESIRNAIWISLLDSEQSIRYWRTMSRRYYKKHKNTEIVLAITTSSVFGGWIASLAISSHPLGKVIGVLWKVFSVISAAIAFVLPRLRWQELIQDMSRLNGKWIQVQSQYGILFLDYESGRDLDEILEEYKRIKQREPLEEEESPSLPGDDNGLWDECYWEVRESRGFGKEE